MHRGALNYLLKKVLYKTTATTLLVRKSEIWEPSSTTSKVEYTYSVYYISHTSSSKGVPIEG